MHRGRVAQRVGRDPSFRERGVAVRCLSAGGAALLRWRPNQSLRRRRGRRQLDPSRRGEERRRVRWPTVLLSSATDGGLLLVLARFVRGLSTHQGLRLPAAAEDLRNCSQVSPRAGRLPSGRGPNRSGSVLRRYEAEHSPLTCTVSSQVGASNGQVCSSRSSQQFAVAGPFISLDPGTYEIVAAVEMMDGAPAAGSLQVVSSRGNHSIARSSFQLLAAAGESWVMLPFAVERKRYEVEFRLLGPPGACGRLHRSPSLAVPRRAGRCASRCRQSAVNTSLPRRMAGTTSARIEVRRVFGSSST